MHSLDDRDLLALDHGLIDLIAEDFAVGCLVLLILGHFLILCVLDLDLLPPAHGLVFHGLRIQHGDGGKFASLAPKADDVGGNQALMQDVLHQIREGVLLVHGLAILAQRGEALAPGRMAQADHRAQEPVAL